MSASPVDRDRRSDIRRAVLVSTVGWVWARICIAAGFGIAHIAHTPGDGNRIHEGLIAWDGAFYVNLSQTGYSGAPADAVRFFPLFPTLGKALSPVFLGREDIALIVLANAERPRRSGPVVVPRLGDLR